MDIGNYKELLEKNKNNSCDPDTVAACFRSISEQARGNINKAQELLIAFDIDYLTDIICYSNENNLLTSYQFMVQTFINTLAGVHIQTNKIKEQAKQDLNRTKTVSESLHSKTQKKIDEATLKQNESIIFNIILRILRRSSSFLISGQARDCLLGILLCNIDYDNLNFGVKLVTEGCIQTLLDIGSEIVELKSASSMEITNMTHQMVAGVLNKIYFCHDHDKVRQTFREQVQSYINIRLKNPDMVDKTRAAKLFTILLQGPTEIGTSIVGQDGIVEMLIAMASSDDFVQQKVALDAIIAASIKKDKCAAFAKLGEGVLNRLRESKNEDIRLRALVCLSKISSVGSTDAVIRPLGKDANINFARDCREIISRPTPDFGLKRYAIEGLAFLSFDGDVKDEIVDDCNSLKSIYDTLISDPESPIVYSILTIFVNLTNSYEKQDVSPELIELAKFAKQHIPQEHPKDTKEFLERRLEKLVLTDLVSTLTCCEKTPSTPIKDLLSRIMNALCELEKLRGLIVQQGGVRLLLQIAKNETKPMEKHMLLAAQALARLGITLNPELVYSNQKMIAVIKPLKKLLSPDNTALQNFEGLMALTNLAQVSDETRDQILRDNGFSQIEALMFEEHVMVRRAAVQCVVNLIHNEQVVALYEADNDRAKYLLILCEEEDIETVSAASGALAMLCQVSSKVCEKIFTAKDWYEILMFLLTNESIDLVHRAVVIIQSVVTNVSTELASKIFESKIFEALLALSLPQNSNIPQPIKDIINSCLEEGKKRDLIKKKP